MSIILQIDTSHFNSTAGPFKGAAKADATMAVGSEPTSVEAQISTVDSQLSTAIVTAANASTSPSIAPTTYSNCFGLPYQDHNYGAPPPPTPPQSPAKVNGTLDEDTSTSIVTTSTTNEEDGPGEESITRCICEFDHDDEYMICCDKCSVWQHVDCMGLDRNNIPETYMCEKCEPRKVDKQKAKTLQLRKKEEMTADSSSDESGDENSRVKSAVSGGVVSGPGGKSRKIKRRRREKMEEKVPITPTKRVRRGVKEKVEPRRPQARKRRKSKSCDINHIDEDALDSWDSSMKEWTENYEQAETNQYSPEVHLQLSNVKFNGQHEELARKISEHPRVQLCQVADVSKSAKGLLASTDIHQGQVVCECRGKFLLLSQFQQQNPMFNNRLHPFVLVYSFQKGPEDVCVDFREYGNDARFVRRSCSPNAEVHHIVENGSLHLYIVSLSEITQNDEITIAFDYNYDRRDVECACTKLNCSIASHVKKNGVIERTRGLERRSKKLKRSSVVVDEDSTQLSAQAAAGAATAVTATAAVTAPSAGKPCKLSPLRLSQSNVHPVNSEHSQDEETNEMELESQQNLTGSLTQASDETETEEQAAERRKKMTREERKMEAIMKAFARLEKTQQRRQEALARLALKKEEQEMKKKEVEDKKRELPSTVASMAESCETPEETTTTIAAAAAATTTTAVAAASATAAILCSASAAVSVGIVDGGVPSGDESKLPTSTTVKPRKGKKRKHSGNPMRRRSRMNSGGSDIMSPDESTRGIPDPSPPAPSAPVAQGSVGGTPAVITNPVVPVVTDSPPLSAVSACSGSGNGSGNNGFKFPKTKKLMMSEWLNETTDLVTQPLVIKTEPMDFTTASPTCYMRCARSPTGINLAHLRRSSGGNASSIHHSRQGSTDSSMGSAKKRWLRQAMCDEVVSSEHASPVLNGSMSPTHVIHSPSTSPPVPPDLVTPLKKRRLPRESMSSDTMPSTPPSTPSPSVCAGHGDSSMPECLPGTMSNMEEDEEMMQYDESAVPSTSGDGYQSGIKDPMSEDAVYEDYFKSAAGVECPDVNQVELVGPPSSSDVLYGVATEGLECLARCATDLCPMEAAVDAVGDAECNNPEMEEQQTRVESGRCVEVVPCTSSDPGDGWERGVGEGTVPDSVSEGIVPECSSTAEQVPVMASSSKCEDDGEESSNSTVLPVGEVVENDNSPRPEVDSVMTADSSTEERSDLVAISSTDGSAAVGENCISTLNSEQPVVEDFQTEEESVVPVEDPLPVQPRPDSSASVLASPNDAGIATTSSTMETVPICLASQTTSSESVIPVSSVNPPSVDSTVCGSAGSDECPNQGSAISSSTLTSSLGMLKEFDIGTSQITSTSPGSGGTGGGGVSQSCSSASTSPTANLTASHHAAKRKVSLLEYRKRKMENPLLTGKSASAGCSIPAAASSTSSSSSCTATVSSTSVTSQSPNDLSAPPRLLTLPLFEAGSSDAMKDCRKDNRKRPEEDVRWSNNPTSLEQQRENLTQRLRREFGLITDDDSDTDKEGKKGESIEVVQTQNGRPIGCYPSHPPGPQSSIVRPASMPIVRNIPTIIGITGYQPPPPPPRVLHPQAVAASSAVPQPYAYQQYAGLYATPSQSSQSYAGTQVVSQYATTPLQVQPTRPSITLRPPLAGLSQGSRPPIVMGTQPSTNVDQQVLPPPPPPLPPPHIQSQQALLRAARPLPPPPILPGYHGPQQPYTPSTSSRQQPRYPQGYYQ